MGTDRWAYNLMLPLANVVGDVSRIKQSVLLASVPLHPIFIADIMIYPSKAASLLR